MVVIKHTHTHTESIGEDAGTLEPAHHGDVKRAAAQERPSAGPHETTVTIDPAILLPGTDPKSRQQGLGKHVSARSQQCVHHSQPVSPQVTVSQACGHRPWA